MIYLILKILALFDLTVPGYSRDGPPCAIAKFAGVRYKPAWSKPPIRPDAQRFGLCLRWANKQHTESAMSAPNLNRGEAMSAIDKFRDLPGLVRRLVDDYLSAVKEAEALRQERDGLLKRDINAIAHRICGEIPDGFYIELILENGSGWVSLMHKDEQVDIDMADWNIAEQFNVAMQCVDELAKDQGNGN